MPEFPPVVFIDVYEVAKRPALPWNEHKDRPQKWRWRAISEGNRKKLASSGEAYTNLADLLHSIDLLFGAGTTVFLRQEEQGSQLLRWAEPSGE